MLPVMLDVAGKPVVVVGGGAVGTRKAAAARAAGAVVTVIPEAYRPEHLDGAFLVFACAPPEVNAAVVADARARGVLVCSASDPPAGDFVLPAVVRAGGLAVAVSTGGAAPALARRIREKLEAEFDAAFGAWVRVLAEVRPVVLARVTDPARRRELLDAFADWPWLARVRAEGADAVKAAMLAAVPSEPDA
ncbi:MAG: siroheme synthase [Isosphaera sp.]|nr:siroheme synthase [Isosphaera sp.]